MIIQTQAIVLQIRSWSKTSHMVTWLTPDHGKIVTAVKGACRPKSAFLGQYDLFYTCDLLFYRREHEGIHAIRECTPIVLRESLRNCWRQTTAAAYLADLTARVAMSHQEAAALFTLLTEALDSLVISSSGKLPALLLAYEIHLLRLLGLMPDLTLCTVCHTPDRLWLRFSLASGRFLCPHLAHNQPGEATIAIHRNVCALFRQLSQSSATDRFNEPLFDTNASKKNIISTNLLLGLSRFLGMFITFHLDVPSAVRRVTWEMLDTTTTPKNALLERS